MKTICFLTISIFLLTGCWGASRADLKSREVGLNFHYYQDLKPTIEQQRKGKDAIKQWKNASDTERYFLAEKIIAGGNLIGMTNKEINDSLGQVTLIYKMTSENEAIPEGIEGHISQYNIMPDFPTKESTCDLCAKYGKNGKVCDAYIDVNPEVSKFVRLNILN